MGHVWLCVMIIEFRYKSGRLSWNFYRRLCHGSSVPIPESKVLQDHCHGPETSHVRQPRWVGPLFGLGLLTDYHLVNYKNVLDKNLCVAFSCMPSSYQMQYIFDK